MGYRPAQAMRLDFIERNLARPGGTRLGAREIERYLFSLHHEVLRRSRERSEGDKVHSELHHLLARARRARSAQEIRELLRSVRLFQSALDAASQADIEARLDTLERSARTASDADVGEALAEAESITLEGLKGKRILFAMMPFADNFEDVWIGGIKRAAAGTGLTPLRIDMLTESSEITDDIVKAIRQSKVIVVDVTSNNPNVMFEFGFALALGKKPVVISQSSEYLTFDIKNLRTVLYKNTWQGIETLHKDLQPFIKAAQGTKKVRRVQSSPKKTD